MQKTNNNKKMTWSDLKSCCHISTLLGFEIGM